MLLAQVAMFGLAAGHGGSYTALALPATASRQLLVPAVIALFFRYVARRSWPVLATLAVAAGALALVHPTYALFVLIPLVGYVVARLVLARTELVEGVLALAAVVVPAGLVALWLRPIARETVSVNPSGDELTRALQHYRNQLDVFTDGSYRLAPEVVGRAGAVAVLALFAVPLRRPGRAPALGRVRDRRLPRRARARCCGRRCSPTSPTPCRSRRRAAPPASCRSRSRSRAARPCSRGCSRSEPSRWGSGRASRSSSPIRGTSATRSTTAGPRWRRGWRSSAPPQRWCSEPSCRAD